MMSSRPPPVELKEYGDPKTVQLAPEQAEALKDKDRFGEYIDIDPAWGEPGSYELRAKQYVGTIVLGDVRIVIWPKVPVENLFYMLTYAYDYDLLKPFPEEADLEVSDLLEIVVRLFVRRVEDLVRRGIYRSYITYDDNHTFLRGRLLMAEHLRRNAVQVQRFYQRIHEYTADVLENRILRFTLEQLLQLDYRRPELRQHLRRALSAFGEVSFTPIRPEMCDQVIYTRLNSAYRRPISLARLLLQHLSLEERPGEVPFVTFLVNMNRVFERFVTEFLKEHLNIQDQEEIRLNSEEDKEEEVGKPDIILLRNGQRCLVLDTKYKKFDNNPDEADRNQMFMYCHALNLPQGILIYPHDGPISYERHFQHVTIRAWALPLSGSLDEFREHCQKFADDLRALAQELVIGTEMHVPA